MTNATRKEFKWTRFLKFYGEQNQGRRTRLGVFESGTDYWIEDGLPLSGIDLDTSGEGLTVELMLGEEMTHQISRVRNIRISMSPDEINDGLDITDSAGRTTILRFED